jgi:hypothetical protein
MGVGYTYHEVDLEMRLSTRAERINTSILLLICDIFLALLEILINPREANKFKQSTAHRTSLVLSIGRNCAVMLRTGAEEVVIESQSILQSENMGQDRVIEEILADMLGFDNGLDSMSSEFFLWADSRKH